MKPNRRDFWRFGALSGALCAFDWKRSTSRTRSRALAENAYRPVVTPNGSTLPFRLVDGAKVFHLIAEEVDHEFAPELGGRCYGYNGQVHGPTIEAVLGDHVRIYVTNRLESPTTVHWHGLHIPNGMDGVSGLSQRPIQPGETFLYEFTLEQHGTYMYHSHHDEMVQMALGLMGLFIIHPREPEVSPPDRDYAYLLSEWAIKPGLLRPDVNEMVDFNVLTMNGKSFPGTTPMIAKVGEKVRIRFANLSAMSHHPMHLHGTSFWVVATDGGVIPEAARWPETTVLVPVGSTRTIEFVATEPGDWAVHCHMSHHTMTQMGHGIPNLVGLDSGQFDAAIARHLSAFASEIAGHEGAEEGDGGNLPRNSAPMFGDFGPFGFIPMGGMFTLIKVREDLPADATLDTDLGFYRAREKAQAAPAKPEDLARDGIVI